MAMKLAVLLACAAAALPALAEEHVAGLDRSAFEARAQRIRDELSLAEAKVAADLRGHPAELRKTEGLLEQASQLISRGGTARRAWSGILARHRRQYRMRRHHAARGEAHAGAEARLSTGAMPRRTASEELHLNQQGTRNLQYMKGLEQKVAAWLGQGGAGRAEQLQVGAAASEAGAEVLLHRTAKAEVRLGRDDVQTFKAMQGMESEVSLALAGVDARKAAKVEGLLRLAERDQLTAARLDLRSAKEELLLEREAKGASADMHTNHRQQSGSKHEGQGGQGHLASLAALTGGGRARAARAAERRLDMDEHMFRESGRIAGEIRRARRATIQALGGGEAASAVSSLLARAQRAADGAAESQGREWVSAAKYLEHTDPKAAEAKAAALRRELRHQR